MFILDKLAGSSRHIYRLFPDQSRTLLQSIARNTGAGGVHDEDKWVRFPEAAARSDCRCVSIRRKSFC